MAKRAPKYKKIQQKYRSNAGTYISEQTARKIVRANAGKRLTKTAVAKYFEKNPVVRRERIKAPDTKTFLPKEQEQEIRQAAKQLGIPLKQAAAIYFESKIKITEKTAKPLHELERMAEDLQQRNKELRIKIKRGDGSRAKVYRGDAALAALREIGRAVYAEALAEQNRGLPKSQRSSRLDSDRIPNLEITKERRSGQIVPEVLTFDFSKVTSKAEQQAQDEIIKQLQDKLPPPRSKAARGAKKGKK